MNKNVKKIYDLESLLPIVEKHRRDGQVIGLITGCFDVLHYGHVMYFRFAKKHCNILLVGLDTDENITLNKGINRPMFSYSSRSQVVSELTSVDYVFRMEGCTKYITLSADDVIEQLLKKIKPDVLILHDKADKSTSRKITICDRCGVMPIIDYSEKVTSSTEIIEQQMRGTK